MKKWPLQEAKARLSELVKQAMADGPQTVTLRGKPVVVILSQEKYHSLKKPTLPLVEFMRRSPLAGVELDIERDSSSTRESDL